MRQLAAKLLKLLQLKKSTAHVLNFAKKVTSPLENEFRRVTRFGEKTLGAISARFDKSTRFLSKCHGVILRDSHGVAQVRWVTGNKILRILKAKGFAPDLPEDLYHLIKKAVAVRKHLERNRKDKDSKFRLILIESRIHRLARYFKGKRVLPPNWK
ncbi:UNVERIFIED_CONTAM: Rps13 [Trichonephila clavipes]